MRLGADRRARVPFALVGVVLLVASAGYAASLAGPGPTESRPTTTRALSEATTGARVALRAAVHEAARGTALHPVVAAANTSYGGLLAGPASVRRSLRLRVAVALRDALARVDATAGETRASVSVPAIDDPQAARRALQAVSIVRVAGAEDRLRVTVGGLQARAVRAGRTVATRSYAATVTVHTPVLRLHERVDAYAAALRGGPTESGFARRLTARLTAVAWARGWAQYAGAPVENVLANRHVEVATNGALLATQAAVLGGEDRRAARHHRCAAARLGARDLMAARNGSLPAWTDRVLGEPCRAAQRLLDPRAPVDPADEVTTTRLSLADAADEAYLALVDEPGQPPSLGAVVRAATGATLRVHTRTDRLDARLDPALRPAGWRPVGTTRSRSVAVEATSLAPHTVSPPRGWTLADRQARLVTVETRIERRWRREGETRTTTGTRRERYLVSLDVLGQAGPAPGDPGPLTESARARLVGRAYADGADALPGDGDPDVWARRAVTGTLESEGVRVPVAPAEGTYRQARTAATGVLRRARNESVAVDGTALADGPPADRLVDALAARRDRLRTATPPYRNRTARAEAAAERAYLDALRQELTSRRATQRGLLDRLEGRLEGLDVPGELLDDSEALLDGVIGDRSRPVDRSGLTVAGAPGYLVRTEVTNDTVPGLDGPYHPLAVRNVNQASLPWTGLARSVADTLIPRTRTVPLGRAGTVLAAGTETVADGTATRPGVGNDTADTGRAGTAEPGVNTSEAALRRLRGRVREGLGALERGLVTELADRTALGGTAATALVDRRLAAHPTLAARVEAATNGSLPTAVARRAAARAAVDVTADRLAVHLRDRAAAVAGSVRVPGSLLGPVAREARRVAHARLEGLVEAGLERGRDRVARRLAREAVVSVPAGVPVTPVPGAWYATVNVWTVSVRAAYARFAVAAPTGDPTLGTDGRLPYVRRNATVTLDVDADGTPERLGRNRRLSVRARTAVVVAVPPGGRGVGDRGGTRNETSPGWGDTAEALYRPTQRGVCSSTKSTTPTGPTRHTSSGATSVASGRSWRRSASRRPPTGPTWTATGWRPSTVTTPRT